MRWEVKREYSMFKRVNFHNMEWGASMERNKDFISSTGEHDGFEVTVGVGVKAENATSKNAKNCGEVAQNTGNMKPAVRKALLIIGGVALVGIGFYLVRRGLLQEIAWRDTVISSLQDRLVDLESLCEIKDRYFKEMISDGLRRGSPLAAQHMADRRYFLLNKVA